MLEKVTRKDILKFAWYYWRQYKLGVFLTLLCLGMAAFIDALFPLAIGYLIDQINSFDVGEEKFPKSIITAFLIFIALDIAYHIVRQAGHLAFTRYAAVHNLHDIVTDGFDKVQRFSSDWHMNSFAGATVRKITRAKWAFDQFEDIIFMNFFPSAIMMTSIIILMFVQWPIMGVMTIAVIAIYIAVSLWTVMVINAPNFRASAKKDTAVGAALADAVTGNPTVKAFGSEESENIRFRGVIGSWRDTTIKSWSIATGTDLIRRLVAGLIFALMMGTILYLLSQGKADVGDTVYVFTSVWVILAYLRHMGEQISNLQKAITEMEDVVHYWKTDITVKDKAGAALLKRGEGKITFDQITFTYNNQDMPIYQDFSIHIKPGEKVALVGHSGSGKSTFVKLLQRLYDIQGGEIRVDGQNIADVTQSSLRQAIALVPQDPILFHRTLSDNIAYGKDDTAMEEIIVAAKRAYAHEFIESLPQGYDTLVGERGIKLSGGERQRVAIARAILSDAPILILDEATSSLDSISENYIQMALKELMKGRTTITIAHRLSTIKDVDRILVFDQGRVVEQGNHAKLLENPDSHYKKLYDMQVLGLVD